MDMLCISYVWSMFLIGTIWDSLTNLLLHLRKERHTNKNIAASIELELKEIKYSEVRDETRNSSNYPLLSSKEAFTYTLELKVE